MAGAIGRIRKHPYLYNLCNTNTSHVTSKKDYDIAFSFQNVNITHALKKVIELPPYNSKNENIGSIYVVSPANFDFSLKKVIELPPYNSKNENIGSISVIQNYVLNVSLFK